MQRLYNKSSELENGFITLALNGLVLEKGLGIRIDGTDFAHVSALPPVVLIFMDETEQ